MSEDGVPTLENIPVPPCPPASKSSKEILCELFSAFNAKPPVLDDITSQETKSTISDKSNKKHKKHTKKKHKKVKKRSRSLSSDSDSSSDIKKKSRKKHKKHKSNRKTVDSNQKKKKSKLGKYSASDSDSDEESERKKSNLIKEEKFSKSDCTNSINIKKEIKKEGTSSISEKNAIQETILKHAVSKIVDKVIDSSSISTEGSTKTSKKTTNQSNETDINKSSSGTLLATIKSEPTAERQSSSKVSESNGTYKSSPEKSVVDKETISDNTVKAAEEHVKQPLSVADVFAEDLLDNVGGTKKDNPLIVTEKQKPSVGKITIKNLKFSQVYEDTVKKIEEEAKLKAEKYEDGEISDSSVEQERSPTPSESGSVKERDSNGNRSSKRKKSHKHHRSKESHRHKRLDRKRSISRERYRSRSPSHRFHSQHHRDRYKDRSRDLIRGRSRESSRDRVRDRVSFRSRSRSRDRETRRRSRDKGSSRDRSRSREKHKSKDAHDDPIDKKRSHEKSKHSHGHSKERDKRHSEDKIDKRKLLEIARRNALNMMKTPVGVTDQTKVTITAGGKTVNELTDFCKLLSKKEADGHESISSNTEHSSDSESEKAFHHPFQIRDRSNIVLNIRNSVALPTKSHQEKTAEQSRQLRIQFPVSSGQQHRKTESEWVPVSPKKTESVTSVTNTNTQVAIIKPNRQKRVFKDTPDPPKVDIGSIVSQRLEAMRRLQENPCDSEALSQMYKAQQHMKTWAESKQETGQFTGSTGVKVLSAAELSSGYQAWARKDQLQAAAPVTSGMGMALLQKMGWRPGEGLGKNKEGTLQPLLLEVKMDKKGLVAQEELPIRQPHQVMKGPPRRITSLEGKHPVSLLNEYCSRRKYGPPVYELIDEAGPDHKKNFLFKVKVNGIEYKPAVGSPKKKQARAEAAEVCLKTLGVLPNK